MESFYLTLFYQIRVTKTVARRQLHHRSEVIIGAKGKSLEMRLKPRNIWGRSLGNPS